MVETGIKTVLGTKSTNTTIKTKNTEIKDLINEINDNLNKNSLISIDNMCFVLDLLDVLKANYDGKHTISLTDLESRWMMDKKEIWV